MADQELDSTTISRIKDIQEKIKNDKDKVEQKKKFDDIVRQIISKLDSLSNPKFPSDISINNLDEIKASLRNELTRANKPLAKLIKDQTSFIKKVKGSDPKPNDKVSVTNLKEITFPKSFSISNLNDLERHFRMLSESLKSPDIKFPQIDIPELDLSPLIKEIRKGLHNIKSNSMTRPLAVRLSDGQSWLNTIVGKMEAMSTTLSGFSDQIRLRSVTGGVINPATQEGQDNILAALGGITSTDLEGLGLNTVGTSAVPLVFTGTTESIRVSSPVTNTGTLYIGKSDVTSAGANAIEFLLPGEGLTLDYEDGTNAINVISDTASQQYMAGALK